MGLRGPEPGRRELQQGHRAAENQSQRLEQSPEAVVECLGEGRGGKQVGTKRLMVWTGAGSRGAEAGTLEELRRPCSSTRNPPEKACIV